ncbi:hypothetical protein LCGC14_0949630 [marine sediment metagenome]|uniref:Uncharacterized protein n=1 Tax=marine sediment metagenome TaxID=412755 RepID=A0A0F9RP44_9ZZZZ
MNYTILDAKLKSLIHVCKETGNYKKLAVTCFILTSNQANEIGIRLGIRPRNKDSNESLYQYLRIINSVFEKNLQIRIFKEEYLETIKKCESVFMKNRGNIPIIYIKQILGIYYEFRKLEIPNLYKELNSEEVILTTNLELYSFLAPTVGHKKTKKNNSTNLTPLILQKIRKQEMALQKDLEYKFDSQKLETAIYLNSLKNSLDTKHKKRVAFQGSLKDNLSYKGSLEDIFGHLILGVIILFSGLSISFLVQMTYDPSIVSYISLWIMFLFAGVIILIILYLKMFKRR